MRRSAGSMVWFANIWGAVPVFHDWPIPWTGKTNCGRTIWDKEADRGRQFRGTMLRYDHAQKIGRPCEKCW
jgi:hypothetical protein